MKFERLVAGDYKSDDGAWRIMCHIGRVGAPRTGVHWTVISATEKDANGFPLRVASGGTLADAKKFLARYLADQAAGVLKYSMFYCH
jgi:hypothetical protein